MPEQPWEIVPGKGAGPLRFGQPRTELRELLGEFRAFRRGYACIDLTDQFHSRGLMLTSSPEEGLYLMEIAEPVQVSFQGVELIGRPAQEVLADLRASGAELVESDVGWEFAQGAVALYTPSNEPDATVEAVTLFGPGREAGGDIVWFPNGAHAAAVTSYTVAAGRGVGLVSLGDSRAAVRERLHRGSCWALPANSREPVQDTFWEDGLVVDYDTDETVQRIFVTKAGQVDLDGINLMPPYPATYDGVREAVRQRGVPFTEGEGYLDLTATGVQVWLANAHGDRPLPVCAVVISAVTG